MRAVDAHSPHVPERPAKGKPSRTPFNREFPHRVLILADDMRGPALDGISAFHDDAGLPIKSRSARKDDKWYRLYCFAERRHALSFQLKFGGELLDRPAAKLTV